jgi:hypothetical protein
LIYCAEIDQKERTFWFGGFQGAVPLPAPLKLSLDHFSSNQVVAFVELNLLSCYMMKSIKVAEFSVFGEFEGGSSPSCSLKIEVGSFSIKPSCCIRRPESFELLHDEIDQGNEISVLGSFRGTVPLPALLNLRWDHFSSSQVVPFVELNFLNYYMTKSIKGAEF